MSVPSDRLSALTDCRLQLESGALEGAVDLGEVGDMIGLISSLPTGRFGHCCVDQLTEIFEGLDCSMAGSDVVCRLSKILQDFQTLDEGISHR